MSRTAAGTGPGHERAHDPCRADWHGWTASHPEPAPSRPASAAAAASPNRLSRLMERLRPDENRHRP